jgi:hypothetical protein
MLDDVALLTLLWWALAINRRFDLAIDPSLTKGMVDDEVKKMGLSFFTHALPSVGRALDGFMAGQPIIEPETKILSYPLKRALQGSPVAIDYVRQLAYLFYKLEVPYDTDLVRDFLDGFVKTDSSLSIESRGDNPHVLKMREYVGRALKGANPYDIRPSHGSGATACRTKNHDKYHSFKYFERLDAVYPYSDYFFSGFSHLADEMDSLENSVSGIPQARICIVPKDSRGPRIISCEPLEHMYIQQGLMKKMYNHLETRPLTRGMLNFTDQSINRELARSASLTNALATIDMKDASDRVSLAIVKDVFPDNWFECLMACRTPTTLLPDGRVVELRKFAPMGSSVCFPVEALVFWASAMATQHRLGVLKPEAYVYGDDIIVESKMAEDIMRDFVSIDLIVNRNKSYLSGPFRESCGGDYYLGSDVTPIKMKKGFDSSVLGIARAADFCNDLIAKYGYFDSIITVVDLIQQRIKYVFPRTMHDIPCTLRMSPNSSNDVFRKRVFNRHLQRYEHLILSPKCDAIERHSPNWGELLRWQLTRDEATRSDSTDEGPVMDYSKAYLKNIDFGSSKVEPGYYVDTRSIRKSWKWVWLG